MKKKIAFLLALLMSLLLMCGCDDGMSDYDRTMSSQNWGKGYYYNSSTHRVEQTLGGMLFG